MPQEETGSDSLESGLYEETWNGNGNDLPVKSESEDVVYSGDDLLYQETRNSNANEDPVRSESYDPVYDDSILHDETYTQQDEDSQFTQPQDEVFLGSLQKGEFCTAHSMCASTCCQEPYRNKRMLNDLLY